MYSEQRIKSYEIQFLSDRQPPNSTGKLLRRPLFGVSCLVSGFVLLVLSDATAKWLIRDYPITQIVGLRASIVVLFVIIVSVLRNRVNELRPVNRSGHLRRAVFAAFSGYLFVTGLAYVALIEASAAAYMGPVIMTALAPFMLGERVGAHRWCAVLVGFVGMLVMLRPSPAGMSWAMLLPVTAAIFGALRDLTTRSLSVTESSASMLMTSNLMLFAVGVVAAPFFAWRGFDLTDAALLLLSAVLIGCAHFLHIEAFRNEEASTLAAWRYTGIIWSALFGFLIFGEKPDVWLLAGAALVIAGGLYIVFRERRLLSQEE